MGKQTGISWTGATWNPHQGCIKISPGCKNCYMYTAMARYGKDPRNVHRSADATFYAPLKWKEPQMVFTCSWSDWFIEEADGWRDDAWDVIRRTPHLTYQILTKRPERIADHLPKDWGDGWPNVWLGVSAENQEYANDRIPELLAVPAKTRFVSAEPLLGPVDFSEFQPFSWTPIPRSVRRELKKIYPDGLPPNSMNAQIEKMKLDWVIVGGETGAGRREFKQEWAEAIQKQCQEAGVSFFMKQMGGANPKLAAAAIPAHLNVQEFPGERGAGEITQ